MFLALLLGVFSLAAANQAAKKQCLNTRLSDVGDACMVQSQLDTCRASLERVDATPMMITRDAETSQLFSVSAHATAWEELLAFTREAMDDKEGAKMYFRATLEGVPAALKDLFPMRVDSNDELGALIALAKVVNRVPILHSVLTETEQPTVAPTFLPHAFVDVTRQTFLGVKDGRDTGLISQRVMKFTKQHARTTMKITYADNLRVIKHGRACYWDVFVDGKNCPMPITNGKYTYNNGNDHEGTAIVGLCTGLAAGEHTITVNVRESAADADCYTGWYATAQRDAYFFEAAEINPEGQITTKMFPKKHDGLDSGVLGGRTMTFNKVNQASDIRIEWQTNLRSYSASHTSQCFWEILIDGKNCASPSRLRVGLHTYKNDNDHIPVDMIGWCKGISAGQHTITIRVEESPSQSDCYTGWNTSDYMEVWEPLAEEQALTYYTQIAHTQVDGADVKPNVRQFSFTKKTAATNLLITYFDNFRVIAANRWCRWEIKIDGWSCRIPLANNVHTYTGENDHHPGTVIGQCPGISAGQHTLTIALTRHESGADCYTGWQTHTLIEVREIESDGPVTALTEPTYTAVTRKTFPGVIDARDNGALTGRTLAFTKKDASALMRLTYSDNLRVRVHGKGCEWHLKVDGKECAIIVGAAKYNIDQDNDHENHAITGTCPNISAGAHTMRVDVKQHNSGADCYTGWDGNGGKDAYFMEANEINPKGKLTSKMFAPKADGRDSGLVTGRSFTFNKASGTSEVRIMWNTNLRVYAASHTVSCNWEVLIDGQSCTSPSKLFLSMHTYKNDNNHIPAQMVGWCRNLARGPHTLTVMVKENQSQADCYTGWVTGDYFEVWEPLPAEKALVSYKQFYASNRGEDETPNLPGRSFKFTKKKNMSNIRIMYYDNFRVISNSGGRWCRWEITVNGFSCQIPLANTVHTNTAENDHHPGTVIGQCPNLGAGEHELRIRLTRSSTNADCYTGWQSHSLIEIQEEDRQAADPALTWKPNTLGVTRLTNGGANNIDARDNGKLNNRVMKFKKTQANTMVKLTYSDNLRVIRKGDAVTCIWSIKVDDKNCKLPIENAKHSTKGNDHENHAIVGLCEGLTAGDHTMTVDVRNEGGADCYTGWDANGGKDAFFMEAVELAPGGQLTSKMFPQKLDGADTGILAGRTMTFNKISGSSEVRITWQSNLRVLRNDNTGVCNWEILIDGQSCVMPTNLFVSLHSYKTENEHVPVEMVGWCRGLTRGSHTLTVRVAETATQTDCYTGWKTSDYMEVWEPSPAELERVSYVQLKQNNGADNGNVRTFKFTKKKDATNVRVTYFDNFRTVNNSGSWCRWEVKFDGQSCPKPLANTVHTNSGENDHRPGTVIGNCAGLKAGVRTVTVVITRTGNADCYTGWQSHTMIEIIEDA